MTQNREVVFRKSRGVRALHRAEPTNDGRGVRSVEDGQEEFFYETAIDPEALGWLAEKAARNKTGKAKSGALHVRILSRRKLDRVSA